MSFVIETDEAGNIVSGASRSDKTLNELLGPVTCEEADEFTTGLAEIEAAERDASRDSRTLRFA